MSKEHSNIGDRMKTFERLGTTVATQLVTRSRIAVQGFEPLGRYPIETRVKLLFGDVV